MKKLKPVTPGELLREEFLIPLGLSKYRLAKNVCEKPQSDNLAAWKGIHTPVTSRMNNGH
jgi:plasmid maintenance system antidote protein VapI